MNEITAPEALWDRAAGTLNRLPRVASIDGVRGLALMSMFIAHCAPATGLGRPLLVTEFLTAPLFALIIGIGAQMSRSRGVTWPTIVLRAAVLIALGSWLATWGTPILIVLAYLGFLLPIAYAATRLRGSVLITLAVLLIPLSAWARGLFPKRMLYGFLADPMGWISALTVSGWAYRLSALTVWAIAGILVARRWVLTPRPKEQAIAGVALALVTAAVFMFRLLGALELHPYSGTAVEITFNLFLVVGFFAICDAVLRRLPSPVTRLLADPGRMTLTLYTAQIGWLAYYGRVLYPGRVDDTWANVAILCLGSIAFAAAWTHLVSGPLVRASDRAERAGRASGALRWASAWAGRGPLEGAVSELERLLPGTRAAARARPAQPVNPR